MRAAAPALAQHSMGGSRRDRQAGPHGAGHSARSPVATAVWPPAPRLCHDPLRASMPSHGAWRNAAGGGALAKLARSRAWALVTCTFRPLVTSAPGPPLLARVAAAAVVDPNVILNTAERGAGRVALGVMRPVPELLPRPRSALARRPSCAGDRGRLGAIRLPGRSADPLLAPSSAAAGRWAGP